MTHGLGSIGGSPEAEAGDRSSAKRKESYKGKSSVPELGFFHRENKLCSTLPSSELLIAIS